MVKYLSIEQIIDWKELIPKIEPNICALLLRSNNNFIVGWGKKIDFNAQQQFSFDDFQKFRTDFKSEYTFGYLSYDVKNSIENFLESSNRDILEFPLAYFFIPEHVLISTDGKITYFGDWSKQNLKEWLASPVNQSLHTNSKVSLTANTSAEQYAKKFNLIKEHLQKGNIYEMNYCINFSANAENFSPFEAFKKLNHIANSPFSCYLNLEFGAVISSSPERFLKKHSNKLISQPIKGTAARKSDPLLDDLQKYQLQNEPKERAENIMIVDLVRNDMSKIANKNSVSVSELCNIYTFSTIHQMISTIECEIAGFISDADIFKALFPMGSMTGAPKFSAMMIAEELEDFRRGLYAGTIGYFDPNGNFDFNVVIRTLLYNQLKKIIEVAVGGAITIKSNPESEYIECLTKLEGLRKTLC